MNLNKSTHYALQAALELALAGGRPVTAARVAARHGIPENVVAKVLQQFVRVGMASAARGVGGGYRLARPATDVTVQDVIDIFEPVLPLDARVSRGAGAPERRLRELFLEVDETTA